MRRVVRRAFDQILTGTGYFAGMVCVLMVLIVTYEVVLRYFFDRPTRWVFDISTLGLLFLTPIAAAWVLRQEGHVRIDILLLRLDPKNQAIINGITSLVALLACIVFLWKGCEVMWDAYQTGELLLRSLIIPKHLVLWPFPLGAFLLCIQFALRTWGYLHQFTALSSKKGEDPKKAF